GGDAGDRRSPACGARPPLARGRVAGRISHAGELSFTGSSRAPVWPRWTPGRRTCQRRRAHQRGHRSVEPMDATTARRASSAAPATAFSRGKPISARLLRARLGVSITAAALLLLRGTASAQTTYGLIEGRISDATNAALPGATVTVTQPTTSFVR